MTESRTRFEVRRALDQLKPYLSAFVSARLGRSAEAVTRSGDMQGLLKVLLANWNGVFSTSLSSTSRHYAFELKDVRNRWAHEAQFTEAEARRAVDTAALLAEAIGAPKQVVTSIRRVSEESAPPHVAASPAAKTVNRKPSAGPRISHRDVMRRIYAQFRPDEARIVREYAAAESRGEVPRQSNAYDLDAEEYARRLLSDGKKKGWLHIET